MSLSDDMQADADALGKSDASQPKSLSQQMAADAAAVSSPAPVVKTAPSTKLERFATGLADLPNKGAQLLVHSLPDSVVNSGNEFNNWLADKTGFVAKIPEGGVDQMVNEREQAYKAAREAAGSEGFDWMRLAGNIANPANYVLPGAGTGASLGGAVARSGLQGAVSSVLSTPTVGEDQANFWGSQGKQAVLGAIFGGGLGGLAYTASPYASRAWTAIKDILPSAKATADQAADITRDSFTKAGVDLTSVPKDIAENFKAQVRQALDHGETPNPQTLKNLAEAQSLPVPVPMLRGQAARDPMQYAKEMNLRGIEGVGEPITQTMQAQNKALIENLDRMGAKQAPNIVDAGQRVIDTIKSIDQRAQSDVSNAYQAFKNSTGKSLDVPLQGVAQDYARVLHEFGDAVPSGIRNQFEALGLLSGTQKKVFSIEDAEGLLKSINRQYDPSNRASAAALDDLRRSVQSSIANGAGSNVAGAEAQQLAQQARQMAAQRFKLIDAVPAYKAAISDVAPDKFLQKFFWNGNAGDVANLKKLVATDPEALQTLKAGIMGRIKDDALNGQTAENGIFSQAAYNRTVRDQNNVKRLGALFEPSELSAMQRLGNVAENVMLPPKASAVNTSNTAGAAANLVQTAAQGGPLNKAMAILGRQQIPVVSPLSAGIAQKGSSSALRDLVGKSVAPLSPGDISNVLNLLNNRAGTLGALAGQQANR